MRRMEPTLDTVVYLDGRACKRVIGVLELGNEERSVNSEEDSAFEQVEKSRGHSMNLIKERG